MGFFDFVWQDPPKRPAPELGPRPRKFRITPESPEIEVVPPDNERGDEFLPRADETPSPQRDAGDTLKATLGEPPRIDTKPAKAPDGVSLLKKRAQLKDFALARSLKALDDLERDGNLTDMAKVKVADARNELRAADPTHYAKIAERLNKWIDEENRFSGIPGPDVYGPQGIGPLDATGGQKRWMKPIAPASMRELEDASLEYGKIAQQGDAPSVGYNELLAQGPQVADAQRLKDVQAVREQLNKDFSNPGLTEERRKEIAQKLDAAAVDEQRLKERLARVGLPPGVHSMASAANAAMAGFLNAREPDQKANIEGAFEGAGVSRKQLDQYMVDAMDELLQAMGGKVDFAKPVPFHSAFRSALPILWPDGVAQFAALAAMGQPGLAMASALAKGAKGAPETPVQQAQRMNEQELLVAAKELANTRDMQSWPAIIAFILLGLVVGPRAALMFFSKAARRGELNATIRHLERRASMLTREREVEIERERWARGQAAGDHLRRQQQHTMRQMLKEKFLQLRPSFLEGLKGQKPDDAKSFEKGVSHHLDLSARAGGIADKLMWDGKADDAKKYQELAMVHYEMAQDLVLKLRAMRGLDKPDEVAK